MAEQDKPEQEQTTAARERQFQVSTNRGRARHKLRYVESSVATGDAGECRLCRPSLSSEPDDSEQCDLEPHDDNS